MQARKALLKKLASVTDWDTAKRAALEGESWIETRNTLYRLRDGVCVAVACRDPRRNGRGEMIVGMRLVGWLVGSGGRARLSYAWEAGGCAVLWRPEDGTTEEAMAMTSPTTSFTRGKSPAALQALHDIRPPNDSRTFQRAGASRLLDAPRPRFPSQHSQSS